MRLAVILAASLFLVQSGSTVRASKTEPPAPRQASLAQQEAWSFIQAGRYREAGDRYRLAFQQEVARGNDAGAVNALNSLASCQLLTSSFHQAMGSYLEAKQLASKISDRRLILGVEANIALLYGTMGDYAKTIEIGERVLRELGDQPSPARPYVLFYLASSYNRTQRFPLAERYFTASAAEADRLGDTRQQAVSLDNLGLAYIDQGDPANAEIYINNAFHLRAMNVRDELSLSYRSLGKLNRLQGKLDRANFFLTKAIDAQRTQKTKIHELYAERARIRQEIGDVRGALDDFRSALEYIRRWRLELVHAAASLQARSESDIHELRSSFIRFASNQVPRTGSSDLTLEALVAVEESRFASLRIAAARKPDAMPDEYQEKLAELRNTDTKLLNSPAPAAQAELRKLQTELVELETRANLSMPLSAPPANPIAFAKQIIKEIDSNEAILSFYLDSPVSYLWAITRGKIRLYRLPSKELLQSSVARFRDAVQQSKADTALLGGELYFQIFGEISPELHTKKIWTVVLDDRLFELPFAALLSRNDSSNPAGEKSFLVEQHVLRVVPSLFMSVSSRSDSGPRTFVGLGDPVYNRADPRLREPASAFTFQLPRLVGSAAEVDRCASSWSGKAVLLKGVEANREKMTQAISGSPMVLHVAAHFVRAKDDGTRTFIALGYNPETGGPDLFGDEQISSLRAQLRLVVLSGCQSGSGETLAGAGLMGLTRSWLLGGALGVTASHWPTPDDTGEIFVRFYRHYTDAIDSKMPYPAAHALQQAQVEMLHSEDWRNAPQYWAAYFLITRG